LEKVAAENPGQVRVFENSYPSRVFARRSATLAPERTLTQHWFEIALSVPTELVDEACALLDFAGFGGVEIRERDHTSDVVLVVDADGDPSAIDARVSEARNAVAILGAGEPRVAELDPRVWTENWKRHFARRTFAGRIEVRPPWEEPPSDTNVHSIVINPGMAFGTGLHETTASCLELLADEVRPGARVADVGCGSGILAIAAAKLGAIFVLATDVDPLAVEATADNVEANGVGGVVSVELEPGEIGIPEWESGARPGLTDERDARKPAERSSSTHISTQRDANVVGATQSKRTPDRGTPNGATDGGFVSRGDGAFDLVVANILAETLVEMCQLLTSAVRPGGCLVLSGIEARRLKSVEEAFIRSPWRCVRTITRGDWVSLSLHRHARAKP
jgi:ribosomal protein L11 methyltransferase